MEAITNVTTNPFPGLRPFNEDEDELYFGMDNHIDELLSKLQQNRFLAVVGASGSGKSSLIKCGLFPALHSGYMVKAGSSWRIATFRPENDPIGNMARALAADGQLYDYNEGEEGDGTEERKIYEAIIESTLRRSKTGLIDAHLQARLPDYENLLIVIDQFEELFRFGQVEKEKNESKRDTIAFVRLFLEACRQKEAPIYIVLTMRSDFLGDTTEFRGLPEMINDSQFLIPRMTREVRKETIVGPIAVADADITDRLLNRLLNDVGDSQDQLPIMQHALMRTWDYWRQNARPDEPLDLHHYEKIGTMSQALSRHADEAIAELRGDEQQICKTVFQALTEKSAEGRGIRRPTNLAELCLITGADSELVCHIIEVFRSPGRSFLMPPSNKVLNEHTVVDISHESLMRIWQKLIHWVEEEAKSADTYKRLADTAERFERGVAKEYRDPELQIALKWQTETRPNKAWARRYDSSFERAIRFLATSEQKDTFEKQQIEERRKQKLRRARRQAIFFGSLSLLMVLLLLLTINLYISGEEAKQEAIDNLERAKDSEQLAKEKEQEAKDNEQIAKDKEQEARENERFAKEQQQLFRAQKDTALALKKEADSLFTIAKDNEEDAKNQAAEALRQSEIAKNRGDSINAQKEELTKAYLRDLSTQLANNSVQEYQRGKRPLAALLAYQAYQYNKANLGPEFKPEIYEALLQFSSDKRVLGRHRDAVRSSAVFAAGNLMATASDDGAIIIWDLKQGHKIAELTNPNEGYKNFKAIGISDDGLFLAAGDVSGNLLVWSKTNGNRYQLATNVSNAHNGSLYSCVFGPNHELFTAGRDGTLLRWDLNTANWAPKTVVSDQGSIADMSLAGTQLAFTSANEVKLLNINAGSAAITIYKTGTSGKIKSVCISNDGAHMAAGATDGSIYYWSLKNGNKAARRLVGHTTVVNDVVFSANDGYLASASSDKTIRIWNYSERFDRTIILDDHSNWVLTLALDTSNNLLYSAGKDGTVRSWPIASGQMIDNICTTAGRNFTTAEWNQYIGENIPCESVCDAYPDNCNK